LRSAAQDVRDPKSGKSIYDAWRNRVRDSSSDAELFDSNGNEKPSPTPRIGALGSGSDYTPFLQHLGVPSMDMGFGGDYGVYHSAYDSFYWMEHFGDPKFQYHVAAAQIWGTITLRLADASGLPLDYTDYAAQLREFVSETKRLAVRRKLGDSFDSKSLLSAVDDFTDEAAKIDKRRRSEVSEGSGSESAARLRRTNDALMQAERALIDDRGLSNRAWFKHQIYAPGFFTGYAALPLPDLRQAIEDGRAADAGEAALRITEAIKRATEVLKRGRE
jgi:N-acetylated-alpha-linked acidic dipeptidase